MNNRANQARRTGLLLEPTYGYRAAFARKPTLRQIWIEWVDSVKFWKDGSRLLPAGYAAYHLATFAVFVAFFFKYFSLVSVLSVLAIASAIATVYNTIWYHRYCTHRAFKFRSIWLARVFLWLNPVCFREESYVIPHRIHHSKSDQPGDPYGPHLSWLGSYLATESQQKINRQITVEDYERLAKSLEHIGFVRNTYAKFQRFGSVENLWHYLARVAVANLFWTSLAYTVAGWRGVLTWISGVFFYSLLVRDFNFRGHGGFLGEHHPGVPLNQVFYGFIAGEWHENHHAYPRSAKSGLAWWQLDIPYWIIRGLAACGAVVQFNEPPERNVTTAEMPEPDAEPT
jgi:stearoyl-CoA desaturase (delta-9 desaturase)